VPKWGADMLSVLELALVRGAAKTNAAGRFQRTAPPPPTRTATHTHGQLPELAS
jgi:hypothetical protein